MSHIRIFKLCIGGRFETAISLLIEGGQMKQEIIKPGVVRRMVEKIASKGINIPKETVDICLTAFLDTIADILSEGDAVILRGYMNIYPKQYKAKEVKNVADQSMVYIPAHYKAKVKVGAKLNAACKDLKGEMSWNE